MWSSGFIGAELGSRAAPASTLLAWRFLPAAVLLAAWLLWRRSRIPLRDLGLHAVIGLLGQCGYLYGVFAAAEQGVPAGTSALLCALQPIVAVALAVPLLGDPLTRKQVAGLGLGLAGVGLVVSGDLAARPGVPAWAYALPAGAMLALVAATLTERRTRPSAGVVEALAIQAIVSAACFTALAAATGELAAPADPRFWTAIVLLIVLAMFGGYGLYWINLARGGVARVSGLLYLTPPATLVWAWLMFGGALPAPSLAGMAVCALAVPLVRAGRAPGRVRPAAADPGASGGNPRPPERTPEATR
nr:DMT family transporter [Actinomadura viridis]